jgi:hypothetical protein
MALISPSRATGKLFGPVGRVVSFGFITDVHHDPLKDADTSQGGKYYKASAQKVADIAAIFNARSDLSFAFQNGDFIDGAASGSAALTDLATITAAYACNVPVYHNNGNHDVWRLTKAQIRSVTGQPSDWYYFDTGGVRFIVLDGNYSADDDAASMEVTSSGSPSPYVSYIAPAQRAWLAATIAASPFPCVIFCHYPIYYTGPFSWGLTNAAAVRAILEAAGGKVIGCVCGHLHDNFVVQSNGITYATLHATVTAAYPSLSYAIVSVYPDLRQIKVTAAGYDMSHIEA